MIIYDNNILIIYYITLHNYYNYNIGYFKLGDCFLGEGNVESSLALFDKVVDVWYKFLSNIYLLSSQGVSGEENAAALINNLSEEQITEGNMQIGMCYFC